MSSLSDIQKRYILHWLRIALIGEALLLFWPSTEHILYIIAVCFLIGFLLRFLNKYPGKQEPLLLDILGVIFALALSTIYSNTIISKFVIMLIAPIIILPHIIYILSSKELI